MKKAAYLLLLLLATLACQSDKGIDPKILQLLEGKWEQTGHQTRENGKTVWVADSTSGKISLIIRADGVPLDANGEGFCCPPKNFLIGGKLYPIEPKSPVKFAEYCAAVDCISCDVVELQITESTLLWISCGGFATRYRRLL